ncbi:MAG: hypothetical protein ABJB86_20400 [Bacteroidota bacterium]
MQVYFPTVMPILQPLMEAGFRRNNEQKVFGNVQSGVRYRTIPEAGAKESQAFKSWAHPGHLHRLWQRCGILHQEMPDK